MLFMIFILLGSCYIASHKGNSPC